MALNLDIKIKCLCMGGYALSQTLIAIKVK